MSKNRIPRPVTGTLAGLAGAAVLVAATLPGTTATAAPAPTTAQAPAQAAAKATPAKQVKALVSSVNGPGVRKHLVALERIGDKHGSRASGTPGYRASKNYVVDQLRKAGYHPQVQSFDFAFFQVTAPPVLERTTPDPTTFVEGTDFDILEYSGSGDVTATVEGVDLALDDIENSTSGCEAEDFAGFTAGNIALVRRGTCDFAVKVVNAQDAGAAAVILMNQGNGEDRSGPYLGTLGGPVGTVPAVTTSFAVGSELDGDTVRVATSTESETRTTWNVTAQTQRGRQGNVVMAGAHLDSVVEGNGINDNGSGSAALLHVAEKLAKKIKAPKNQVRFAWWGAEESGLLGAEHYVGELAAENPRALRDIALYLNFDMVGSPNYALFVYDGDNSAFPAGDDAAEAPKGSDQIEKAFRQFFRSRGLATRPTAFDGRSDYGPFIAEGIPAGGLFTGAEGIKTKSEAKLFGGEAGAAYDGCYHQACDDLSNVNMKAVRVNTKAIASLVGTYAFSTKTVNGRATGHDKRNATTPLAHDHGHRGATVTATR
ncbi:M20/M25/M40 family metallo-hydrolase [Nocardioides abyssi]|uniref:M20/M25/M40 family metallo-hydrolase n=1 Tax=Nocardioides abyssi TaxID=3058370 RepID=A0ABT8ERG9_9ACTN|nr:M20/M25/M40 family metallo-hydrolase [Nocardioides abyssi]MDN4160747.1 M20/M25/M40 family metallo-hydrolase [Nocardioides abyssi]